MAFGLVSLGLLAASRPVAAAPVMSRDQPADPNDDWTLHLALGLEVGAGGTITDFNQFPSNDSTLFFTSVQGTYDLKHGFAALLALREWWLPGPNHALMLGLGTRFEPFGWTWGRSYVDLALGPASTGYAWTFGFDVGLGLDFDLPDVPGFSIGPYFRYGDFINPDRRDSNDGLAWSVGAAFTYHFGRAALAPKQTSEPHARRGGTWHITIPDTDRDGVGDDEDQCKDTPAGAHPDPFRPGCPEGDEDGDGIPDVDDACPVTAAGPEARSEAARLPVPRFGRRRHLGRRRRLRHEARRGVVRPRQERLPRREEEGPGGGPASAVGQGRIDRAQAGQEAPPRRSRAEDDDGRRADQLTTIASRTIAQ